MALSQLLTEFKGEALKNLVIDPLNTLITGINKYNTFPIYTMHFMLNKINYQPKIVLIAYDNKDLLSSMCNNNETLEAILFEAKNEVITPTVIIMDKELDYRSILLANNEDYIYSTSYLIAGNDIKKELQTPGFIDTLSIYSDKNRTRFGCIIKGNYDKEQILISPIPDFNISVKLPFINYSKVSKTYTDILHVISDSTGTYFEDNSLKEVLDKVKNEQMFKFNDDVLLFKDFLKQKPDFLQYYKHVNKNLVSICLRTIYKSTKLQHILFYRYLDGLTDSIKGKYDESLKIKEEKE